MRVKILGAAAGGGFPQWNCSCANCRRLRLGRFSGERRTQAQLAVNTSEDEWTLLNASPDLLRQIEVTAELWSKGDARHSPIKSVILTGAEVDQVLGLLLLREFHSFDIYATTSVRKILIYDNSLFAVLARVPGQVKWHDLQGGEPIRIGEIGIEPFWVPSSFPGYVSAGRRASRALPARSRLRITRQA